eukprot:5465191-Pyramimonas_sp.AAC.1
MMTFTADAFAGAALNISSGVNDLIWAYHTDTFLKGYVVHVWMLGATVWMLGATVRMLGAKVWMLGATVCMVGAMVWMLGAMVWMLGAM